MPRNIPLWGDMSSVPELGRSLGGGHGNLLQYSCPRESHGQRSHSPEGRKESDMAEATSTAQHPFIEADLQM